MMCDLVSHWSTDLLFLSYFWDLIGSTVSMEIELHSPPPHTHIHMLLWILGAKRVLNSSCLIRLRQNTHNYLNYPHPFSVCTKTQRWFIHNQWRDADFLSIHKDPVKHAFCAEVHGEGGVGHCQGKSLHLQRFLSVTDYILCISRWEQELHSLSCAPRQLNTLFLSWSCLLLTLNIQELNIIITF